MFVVTLILLLVGYVNQIYDNNSSCDQDKQAVRPVPSGGEDDSNDDKVTTQNHRQELFEIAVSVRFCLNTVDCFLTLSKIRRFQIMESTCNHVE